MCPKAGSACPFAEFGCVHKGERTTLQKHIREEPTRHLSLLCDGVIELKVYKIDYGRLRYFVY